MNPLDNAQELAVGVYAGGQLAIPDILYLAKAGFKTIICNRPDNEEEGQPCFAAIAGEAAKHGIKAFYLGFASHAIETSHVEEMSKLLKNSTKPIFAYCRSGGRVAKIYSLINANS